MSSERGWEELARLEPHFAVLTHERFLARHLTPGAIDEFFATGEADVRAIFDDIAAYAGREFRPRAALDFGCGVGRLTRALALRSESVTGVDIAPTMLRLARESCPDATFLDRLPDQTFDLICSLIVFQHIPTRRGERILEKLLARLNPGGVAVLQFTLRRPGGLIRRFARRLRAAFPPLHRAIQWLRRDPLRFPYMQMNEYQLPRLLAAIRAAGCREPMQRTTNHGGIPGVILITEKM